GDFRSTDREWADALGLGDRLELIPYAPRATSLALQRDSEALLLLIPDAGGRGKGVLSGKVFEYLAVGRPILAAVPPDGEAAALRGRWHRRTRSPPSMPPSRSSIAALRAGGSPTSCSTRSSDTGSPAGLESRRRSSSCSRSSFSSLAPLREPAAINRKYSYP